MTPKPEMHSSEDERSGNFKNTNLLGWREQLAQDNAVLEPVLYRADDEILAAWRRFQVTISKMLDVIEAAEYALKRRNMMGSWTDEEIRLRDALAALERSEDAEGSHESEAE